MLNQFSVNGSQVGYSLIIPNAITEISLASMAIQLNLQFYNLNVSQPTLKVVIVLLPCFKSINT